MRARKGRHPHLPRALPARPRRRIKEVLSMVYASKANVDDDLVRSIVLPAEDPAAAETFFL